MTDFSKTKSLFHIPVGMTYLVGNSLGPMPIAAKQRLADFMETEWADMLVGGWRKGGRDKAGWYGQPNQLGNRIAGLVGAEQDSVMLGDTLSIKVYQALGAALALRPDRKVILTDTGNFPSDIYIAQNLIKTLGQDIELKIVEPEEIANAIDTDVAVLLLTEVDYRTSRLHDMADLTAKAHEVGALTVWDLAHSAGALPIHLKESGADFAVGCTYKFLNGGPGAPAFIYVAPRHIQNAEPLIAGWMGHEAPFAFEQNYRPAKGIERMRIGTPSVLGMAALEVALDVFDQVDMADVRQKTIELGELLVKQMRQHCAQLKLRSPEDATQRGSHLAFSHENGYAIVQAMIEAGVICDFRAPDTIRFAITPLYIDESELSHAVTTLTHILTERTWDQPKFKMVDTVT